MPKSPRPSVEGRQRGSPNSARFRYPSAEQLQERVCSLEASKRSAEKEKRKEKNQRQRSLSEARKRINHEIATASKEMRKSESVAMKMESQRAQLEQQQQQFGTWKVRQVEYLDSRIGKLRSSQHALEDAMQEQAAAMGEARGRLEHAKMAAQLLDKGIAVGAVSEMKLSGSLDPFAACAPADDVKENLSSKLDAEGMSKLLEKLLEENARVHGENKDLQERLECGMKHSSLEVEVEDLAEQSTDAGRESSAPPSSPSDLSSEPSSARPYLASAQVDCFSARRSPRVNPPRDWPSVSSGVSALAESRLDTVKVGATREDPAEVIPASELSGAAVASGETVDLEERSAVPEPAAGNHMRYRSIAEPMSTPLPRRGSVLSEAAFPIGTVIYSGKAGSRQQPPMRRHSGRSPSPTSVTHRPATPIRRSQRSLTPIRRDVAVTRAEERSRCASPKPVLGVVDILLPATPRANVPACCRARSAGPSRAVMMTSFPQAVPVHVETDAARCRSPSLDIQHRFDPVAWQASQVNVRRVPTVVPASHTSAATVVPGDWRQATMLQATSRTTLAVTPQAPFPAEVSPAQFSAKMNQGSYCMSAYSVCSTEPGDCLVASSRSVVSSLMTEADAEATPEKADVPPIVARKPEADESKGVDESRAGAEVRKRRHSLSSVVHKLTARALQEYREAHLNDP